MLQLPLAKTSEGVAEGIPGKGGAGGAEGLGSAINLLEERVVESDPQSFHQT